jgi:ADP-ribose pyrophosphatase
MQRLEQTVLASSYGTTLNDERWLLDDGRTVARTVVRRPDAAAVVALDGDGLVIAVRQERAAVGEPALLEIPAGKIDAGEAPETAALRELEEEAGVQAGRVVSLGVIYPSPGYTAERIHLFLATELVETAQSLDEGEVVELERLPIEDALASTEDAKSIVALTRAQAVLAARANE